MLHRLIPLIAAFGGYVLGFKTAEAERDPAAAPPGRPVGPPIFDCWGARDRLLELGHTVEALVMTIALLLRSNRPLIGAVAACLGLSPVLLDASQIRDRRDFNRWLAAVRGRFGIDPSPDVPTPNTAATDTPGPATDSDANADADADADADATTEPGAFDELLTMLGRPSAPDATRARIERLEARARQSMPDALAGLLDDQQRRALKTRFGLGG